MLWFTDSETTRHDLEALVELLRREVERARDAPEADRERAADGEQWASGDDLAGPAEEAYYRRSSEQHASIVGSEHR